MSNSILDSGNRTEIVWPMEEWKDVVGYEGLYEVSDMGRIRSKRKNTRIKDKENMIMKQKFDNHGYLRINLTKDKRQRSLLVSRIVAEAFIENPNPEKFNIVGHDNDIKTQNMVCNLYWTDSKENNYHNGKLERFQELHRFKIKQIAEKLSIPIIGMNIKDGSEIRFNSMQEAGRNGFESSKISDCCCGRRKSHRGYVWRKDLWF